MTRSERDELLDQLREMISLCPEMRFGQLIANLAVFARGTETGAVWDMEDDELLKAVKWQLNELAGRRPAVA